uniref:Reverse transcriptase domain-containing protein n=1 Tax=Fagus sylvatica TaxID=28930 RepID=A0A2N9GUD6_FAGSY
MSEELTLLGGDWGSINVFVFRLLERYRREFWESLQEVVREFGGPWMCVGDFNCIISQEEKRGGSKIGSSSGGGLREFMEDRGGIDLGFIGYEFTWCNKRCGLANIKERHLYQSLNPTWPTDLEGLIQPCIEELENERLCRVPSIEEIKGMVREMNPWKALGPDGMPGVPHSEEDGADNFNMFRPISICNFSYKIISKIIVARLRPILERLISPTQAAFVPGRWIAENTVIVHEIVHTFQKKKKGKGLLGIKLDMQKAYDRVEWQFLLKGIKVARSALAITHMLFADDLVLLNSIKSKEVECLAECVSKYCSWSGQAVNLAKSGMFASRNVHRVVLNKIAEDWGCKKISLDAKYLGSPLFLTRRKSKDFEFLAERLEAKISSWSSKYLSWASCITMIRSVAQMIPVYTMSTFKIPTKICDRMDATIRRFWWKNGSNTRRFTAWKNWESLCQPRHCGGMGFRKFKEMNVALLTKMAWLVASNNEKLCVKVLKAKYARNIGAIRVRTKHKCMDGAMGSGSWFRELMITSDNMSYTNFFYNYGPVVIHNPSHPCSRNLYLHLYQSSNPTWPADLEGLIQPCIEELENERLSYVPSVKEIKGTVWEMNPWKAPGPDGMLGVFYQTYWEVKMGADNFNMFRPISICNFSYKIISKIIVARLRPILERLISPTQAAFVPGRWIAENTVIVHEIVHTFQKKKKGKGLLGIKLDMQKAYDRVEWQFLLKGIKVAKLALAITHMLFANDLVLLNSIKSKEVECLAECVSKYCSWSGQAVNLAKSGMFASRNVHRVVLNKITEDWGYKKISLDAKYLGSPLFLTRRKSKDFEFLAESQCQGWRKQEIPLANLIDPLTRWWDVDKLRNFFDAESIKLIKRIPIPVYATDDRVIWAAEKNGKFTTKSAYWLENSYKFNHHNSAFWKKLWKSKLHEKFKVLLWRVAIGALPLNIRCALEGCEDEKMCSLCGIQEESEVHLFKDCHVAKMAWFGTKLCIRLEKFQINSRLDLARNETIFNKKDLILNTLPNHIEKVFAFYYKDSRLDSNMDIQCPQVWKAPQAQGIKMNVDAAWKDGKASLAVIARDHHGECVKVWVLNVVTVSAEAAEAMAVRKAVLKVLEEKYYLVVIEGDAKFVMDSLSNSSHRGSWEAAKIIEDILQLVKVLQGTSLIFQWTRRNSNVVAHLLAKWAFCSGFNGPLTNGTLPGKVAKAIESEKAYL